MIDQWQNCYNDGWQSWDKAGIQIATKQFSRQENDLFSKSLYKSHRIYSSVMTIGEYGNIRIPAKMVSMVREMCLKYVPDSLKYKFGGEFYQTFLIGKILNTCPICKNTFETYESEERIFCGPKCGRKGRGSKWHKKYKQLSLPLKEGVMVYDV